MATTELSKIPDPVRETIAYAISVKRRTIHEHATCCILRDLPCDAANAALAACNIQIALFLDTCESLGIDGEAVVTELRAETAS